MNLPKVADCATYFTPTASPEPPPRACVKLRVLFGALSVLTALTGAGSANAVVSSTDPSDWILRPGQVFQGIAGAFDGVARLVYSDTSVCSGTLLAGGLHVLTAAHCADGFGPKAVDFMFGSVTANVEQVFMHPKYAGNFVDDSGSDIAVLKLDRQITEAKGFNLSLSNDVGKNMLFAGYGLTGTGNSGVSRAFDKAPGATPRFGYNTFDTTRRELNGLTFPIIFGEPDFSTYVAEEYLFDFDDGSDQRNALQRIADQTGGGWTSSTGLFHLEGNVAAGDSGSGSFIWNGSEWLLSGVNVSVGDFCSSISIEGCDALLGRESNYGEVGVASAVFSHVNWINSVTAVPENGTLAMVLFGLVGVGWRYSRSGVTGWSHGAVRFG